MSETVPLDPPRDSDPLRVASGRAGRAPLASQIEECIHQLENPELIVGELVESALQARVRSAADIRTLATTSTSASVPASVDGGPPAAEAGPTDAAEGVEADAPARAPAEPPLSERAVERSRSVERPHFYPSRDLFVRGASSSFTCLAAPANPWAGVGEGRADVAFGFDFAAVSCDARSAPMVGIVQDDEGRSAYPMLLRGLAGIVDLLGETLLIRFDREVFRGMLGPAPSIDLALVIWDDGEDYWERTPVCQFTHDLAELLHEGWSQEPRLPPLLGGIHCLRMNPKRFDGRLRAEWRV